MLRLGQLIHGKGVDKKVTAEQPKEMSKPTKQELLAVVQKFKLNAGDRLVREDELAIAFLGSLGLVTTETEYSLNPKTGQIEQRKMARWLSWRCEDCSHFFVGNMKVKPSLVADEVILKNVPQCRKGFSMEFRDACKGKRCPFFEHKRLKEALDGSVN